MVTAAVYDISPESSAITWLVQQGQDLWLSDFGAPEKEDGWDRTLEDHVLAVVRAIRYIKEVTGQPVHLAGYSQGGMFAYMAAAYIEDEAIASVITFGSPVDLHRNMPLKMHDSIASRLLSVTGQALKGPINELKGVPGILNSIGFKLVNPQQELKYLFKMMGLMHDEEALKRLLPKRRFLGGEGFIAWPGPALRTFVEEYVVRNRLLSGGFVIEGKSTSLMEITAPILCFTGTRDELVRPAAVRAIRHVVAHDQIHEVVVEAGHFGLVVGSKAMSEVWPKVSEWTAWHAGHRPRPFYLDPQEQPSVTPPPKEIPSHPAEQPSLFVELASGMVDQLWKRLGHASVRVTNAVHGMRWQLPRMLRALRIQDETRMSMSRLLAEQAASIPDEPFFFWRDQVHTYEQANRWVDRLVVQLWGQGIKPHDNVGINMHNHPAYLIAVAALMRIGAVPVLLSPQWDKGTLQAAIETCGLSSCLLDQHTVTKWPDTLVLPRIALLSPHHHEAIPEGVDTVILRPDASDQLPPRMEPDPGRAKDVALVLFTAGTTGPPKAIPITHRRWSVGALSSAAAATVTPNDTVYCGIPLYRSSGMLIAVGGALVGGARLILAPDFQRTAVQDLKRLGVSVVFYTAQTAPTLLEMFGPHGTRPRSLRLLAGRGMPPFVWEALDTAFPDLQIIEFYGTAEGHAVMVNLTGEKIGSVGRPLFAQNQSALVRYDQEEDALVLDETGALLSCLPGEEGLLLCQIDEENKPFPFASYVDPSLLEENVFRDVFVPGDRWFVTQDIFRQDTSGDYWFLHPLTRPAQWTRPIASPEDDRLDEGSDLR